MYDLQSVQLAFGHLSMALRIVDHLGARVAGALIDEALNALQQDLNEAMLQSPRSLRDNVDFSVLEAMAEDSFEQAMLHDRITTSSTSAES